MVTPSSVSGQGKIKMQSRNSWLQLATKSEAKLGMRNVLLAAEQFFPDSAHEPRQFIGASQTH